MHRADGSRLDTAVPDGRRTGHRTGSTLSHSAVVARELGIPTVVGVPHVTRILTDGERVRVDGTTGEILRLDHEADVEP